MAIDARNRGEQFLLRAQVQANSTNVTPGTITLKTKDPSGNVSTFTSSQMTSTDTGFYYVQMNPDEEGMWHYQWITTGNGASAQVGQFSVIDNSFD